MSTMKIIVTVIGVVLAAVLRGFAIKKILEGKKPAEEKKAGITTELKTILTKIDRMATTFGWDWFSLVNELLNESLDELAGLMVDAFKGAG